MPAGVSSVEVDPKQNKVTVSGQVEAPEVVKRLRRRAGKKAEPWPQNAAAAGGYYYVPAGVALYGVGAAQLQAHDGGRWANPAARSAEAAIGAEQITDMFSDDNPNACSVM